MSEITLGTPAYPEYVRSSTDWIAKLFSSVKKATSFTTASNLLNRPIVINKSLFKKELQALRKRYNKNPDTFPQLNSKYQNLID